MFDVNKLDIDQEIKSIKQQTGQERGGDILFLLKHAEKTYGQPGLVKLEAELASHGLKIDELWKVGQMDWIDTWVALAVMLASAKVFNWRNQDVYNLGQEAVSLNVTLRLLIRYFISAEATLKKAAHNWNTHYSFGKAEIIAFDKEAKQVVVRLSDFEKHPITCIYLEGVFAKVIGMAVGSKQVTSKEVKCMYQNDPYHEYIFKWQ